MSQLEIEIDRRLFHPGQGGVDAFWNFVQVAWAHVGGDPNAMRFVPAKYMHVMCSEIFQPFMTNRGKCEDPWPVWTLLNIPPSHAKSMLANVMLPAWVWGPACMPEHAFGHLSYADSLVVRDAEKCRTLLESEWYTERWPHAQLVRGRNKSHKYDNVSGGYRACSSIRSPITGFHFNSLLLDDPQNPSKLRLADMSDAAAEAEMARIVIDEVLPSRILGEETRFMVIMQRLSELDASQHLIDKFGSE